MSKDQTKDLLKFLKPFSKEVQDIAFSLREFVWNLYPNANELIYDNYNAVAWGWSVSDRLGHTFCSMAVMRTNQSMHFGFYWGNEITDPEKRLLGQGNQYRYLKVKSIKEFPNTYVKKLLKEAYTNSLAKVKDPKQLKQGLTIVKSISAKKREKIPTALKKKPGNAKRN